MKPLKKSSRAYMAGLALGKALVEMVNLMYQQGTARNFLAGVLSELGKARRHFVKERGPRPVPGFCLGCAHIKVGAKSCRMGMVVIDNRRRCQYRKIGGQ